MNDRHCELPATNAPGQSSYLNLSGYRFVKLDMLPLLQADLQKALADTGVLGTILLAEEGINVALAGAPDTCEAARAVLNAEPRLAGLWLKESPSQILPFSKLKVRVRHEIIAFDGSEARDRQLHRPVAPALSPETVDQWLESGREFTLLDTRNTYEIQSGTFPQAEHLDIAHFRDFQAAVTQAINAGTLDKSKPMVTFCTGGIRCEKAAPWMLEQGFLEVYQIEGGVLNYFEKTGGKHWDGECFVFDDRVEIDKRLEPTGASWCEHCQLTVAPGNLCSCQSENSAMDIV